MKRFSTLALLASTDIGIGFAIQILLLFTVGVGAKTDAYFAGQAPTLVLLAIFQLPIQRAVVSIFSAQAAGPFPALRLYGAVVLVMAVLSALLCVAGEFALHLVYPSFTEESIDLALQVLRIQGVAIAISAGNYVLLSLNQVNGRFILCESILAASSLVAAFWVAITLNWLGVIAAAWGQVLKFVLSGTGYYLLVRRQLTMQHPPWRQVWDVVRPLSGAGLLSKMAPLVDRSIASGAVSGSLTMLVFAQTVYSAAVGVADRAIVAPRLPDLRRDPSLPVVMRVSLRLAAAGAAIVAAMVFAMLVVLRIEWVSRAMPEGVLRLLLEMFILLAGLPIGTLAAQWLSATLVFIDKAKITARIMTWCFIIGVPVKYLGFEWGGIQSLAIAMSCYYLASAAALWFVVRSIGQAAANRPET